MQSSFNNLTQLAAVLNETPIAGLLLENNKVLYCKSCVGITPGKLKAFETVSAASLKKAHDYDCILNIWEDKRLITLNRLKHFPDIKSYHSYRVKNRSGKPIGLLIVLKKDEKKLANQQLKGLKLLAEQVVKLLELNNKNISLKKCQEQLEKTSEKVDDFASMAAHDLKSPIRNIKSFIDLIKMGQDWSNDVTILFDYIDTSISKINLLIHGLMDYARTDNNNGTAEAVNLDQLVTNAFNDSTAGLDLDSVILTKDSLPVIYSHPVLVSIAVHNLINNAIKYNKSNPIEIKIAYKAENNWHVIAFSDNGIGIDPAHFEEIFKPFKRLHTYSEFEGSGLGLATCKRIVKYLKGSISVSSTLGHGSTFTIKLPIIERV